MDTDVLTSEEATDRLGAHLVPAHAGTLADWSQVEQEVQRREASLRRKGAAHVPIWERIAQAAARLPEQTVAQLPTDGARHHDHYLYGSPKGEHR